MLSPCCWVQKNRHPWLNAVGSARDLAKLGQLSLDRGRYGGAEVVPAEWMAASTRAHVEVDDDTEYGYLWWIKPCRAQSGPPLALHVGMRGNRVAVFPDHALVAVVTSQNFRDAEAHPLTEALLEQHVLAALPTWAHPA